MTVRRQSVGASRIFVAMTVSLVLNPVCVQALPTDQLTVQRLVESCSPKQSVDSTAQAHCIGFIAGVLAAFQSLRQLGSVDGPLCLPESGIQPATAVRVVIDWAAAHKDLSSQPAATGVLLAMRERYPCH
jgi:hypothetical protein